MSDHETVSYQDIFSQGAKDALSLKDDPTRRVEFGEIINDLRALISNHPTVDFTELLTNFKQKMSQPAGETNIDPDNEKSTQISESIAEIVYQYELIKLIFNEGVGLLDEEGMEKAASYIEELLNKIGHDAKPRRAASGAFKSIQNIDNSTTELNEKLAYSVARARLEQIKGDLGRYLDVLKIKLGRDLVLSNGEDEIIDPNLEWNVYYKLIQDEATLIFRESSRLARSGSLSEDEYKVLLKKAQLLKESLEIASFSSHPTHARELDFKIEAISRKIVELEGKFTEISNSSSLSKDPDNESKHHDAVVARIEDLVADIEDKLNNQPNYDPTKDLRTNKGVPVKAYLEIQRNSLKRVATSEDDELLIYQLLDLIARIEEKILELESTEAGGVKELSKHPKIAELNIILTTNGYDPFDTNRQEYLVPGSELPIQERIRSERERLSPIITEIFLGDILSEWDSQSAGYLPIKPWSPWGVRINAGLRGETKLTSEDLLGKVPSKIRVDADTYGVEEIDLFSDTLKYLAQVIHFINQEHGRALTLRAYGSPEDFVKILDSAEYNGYQFDPVAIRRLLTFDNDPDQAKLVATERNKPDSVFRAFRELRALFVEMANVPLPGSSAVTAKRYAREFLPFNPYPLGQHEIGADDPIPTLQETYRWIYDKLSATGQYSDTTIGVAFRLALAYNRSTGLEEELDARPKFQKNASGEIVGVEHAKVRSPRTMTRAFHYNWWARYSVQKKGGGRAPRSITLAEHRPKLALPGEDLWFVKVMDQGGVPVNMSLRDVWEKRLWDKVITTPDDFPPNYKGNRRLFPDNPNQIFAQHLRYMMLPYYKASEMQGGATEILPSLNDLANYEPIYKALKDRELARKLQQSGRVAGHLTVDLANYFLDHLYTDNPVERLVTVHVDEQPEFDTANAFKDAADYSWDNTPQIPEIFEELWRNKDGTPMDNVMEALRLGDKPRYVMAAFWTLVIAELERWSIPEKEVEAVDREWNKGNLDIQNHVETVSKRAPLHWGQRKALKIWLLRFQANLPIEYRRYALDEDSIDSVFRRLRIEGNSAQKKADVTWVLSKDVLRSKMQAMPGLHRWLDWFFDLTGLDEYTT